MIKTIIFDIGGVVYKTNFLNIYTGFALRIGIKPEIVIDYYSREKLDVSLLGNISLEEFWQEMRNAGGKSDIPFEDIWFEEANKNRKMNDELISIIKKLRDKYKVGTLTNLTYARLYVDEKDNIYSNFDYKILSCIEHLKKPDHAFYELALKKAGVKPSEAVFIDDMKEFIDGAEKLGIKSILFKDNKSLKKELSEILGEEI